MKKKLCGREGNVVWCYCGKCKPESYPLPKDFQKIGNLLHKERNQYIIGTIPWNVLNKAIVKCEKYLLKKSPTSSNN